MILVNSMAISVSVLRAIRGTYSWKVYKVDTANRKYVALTG